MLRVLCPELPGWKVVRSWETWGAQGAATCTPAGSCFPGEVREGLGGPEFLLKLGQDEDGLGILIS